MPEISRFYGMSIQLFYDDHNPPHFHITYGSYKAVFAINTLELLEGRLPKKQALLIVQWAYLHRHELLIAWESVKHRKVPKKIRPLKEY